MSLLFRGKIIQAAEDLSCSISRILRAICGWMWNPSGVKARMFIFCHSWRDCYRRFWIIPELMRRCTVNSESAASQMRAKDLAFYLEDSKCAIASWHCLVFIFDHPTDESLIILFMCCLLRKKSFLNTACASNRCQQFLLSLVARNAAEPFKIGCESSLFCFIGQTKEGPFYLQFVHHWVVFSCAIGFCVFAVLITSSG